MDGLDRDERASINLGRAYFYVILPISVSFFYVVIVLNIFQEVRLWVLSLLGIYEICQCKR